MGIEAFPGIIGEVWVVIKNDQQLNVDGKDLPGIRLSAADAWSFAERLSFLASKVESEAKDERFCRFYKALEQIACMTHNENAARQMEFIAMEALKND